MTEIQDKATEVLRYFTTTQRDGETINIKTDDAPGNVEDMVYTAHGDMLPDDYRYAFIVESLNALEENEDTDEAQQQACEPDTYYHKLNSWFTSRIGRANYVDEAVSEFGLGSDVDTHTRIGWGQYLEKSEVFYTVLTWLEEEIA